MEGEEDGSPEEGEFSNKQSIGIQRRGSLISNNSQVNQMPQQSNSRSKHTKPVSGKKL